MRFDTQATGFDGRAGIGADAASAVAEAVVAFARLAPASGAPLLEIGPGTGEIGARLAKAVPSYLGLDASGPMLEQFRRRSGACLALADADRPWPVRSAAVGLVFSSRAAHLLDRRHAVAEVARVLKPGGLFLLGRVRRDPAGLRERLRRRRRQLLAEHGLDPGADGGERGRRLLDDLVSAGGERLPARTAARWTVVTDPALVVANWRVGGKPMPDPVLANLQAWAPRAPETEEETYTLDAIRLP